MGTPVLVRSLSVPRRPPRSSAQFFALLLPHVSHLPRCIWRARRPRAVAPWFAAHEPRPAALLVPRYGLVAGPTHPRPPVRVVRTDVRLCAVQPGVHLAVLFMVHALPPPSSPTCSVFVVERRRLGRRSGGLACRSVQARVLGRRRVFWSLAEKLALRRWTCMGAWKRHGGLRFGGDALAIGS